MVVVKNQVFGFLSEDWQDVLVNATVVFSDVCIICAIILIAIGATCLSVYSCIAIIKGGKHEKDI